jgi:hypothetical protein
VCVPNTHNAFLIGIHVVRSQFPNSHKTRHKVVKPLRTFRTMFIHNSFFRQYIIKLYVYVVFVVCWGYILQEHGIFTWDENGVGPFIWPGDRSQLCDNAIKYRLTCICLLMLTQQCVLRYLCVVEPTAATRAGRTNTKPNNNVPKCVKTLCTENINDSTIEM